MHQFVVTFGLLGIIGTITNIIKAEDNAKALGWPGGPFQIKYGFSQLGLGVMGVMCIWFRGGFWLGTLVSMYIYGVSGLWSHIAEMKRQGKATVNDVGNLIIDVIYQIMLTVLSVYAGCYLLDVDRSVFWYDDELFRECSWYLLPQKE